MSLPAICYQNHAENAASISASSEAAGFPKENALDWLTYDYWKGTGSTDEYITFDMGAAVDVDYWAVFASDAAAQGSLYQLRASTDNFAASDVLISLDVPSDTAPIVHALGSTYNYRYWRIHASGGSAPTSTGVFAFGERLDLPDGMQVGFIPPTMSYEDRVLNSISHGGAFLGRSVIREGAAGSMRLDLMTPAWVRASWLPFIEHARLKPFFLTWDYSNYPDEAAYCWTDKKITPSRYSRPNWMTAALNYRGLVE